MKRSNKAFVFLSFMNSFPCVPRQIGSDKWYSGELYLQANPTETRVCVCKYNINNVWEYWVVRTSTGFEYQTWLDGTRIH